MRWIPIVLAICIPSDQWLTAEETFGERVILGPQSGREDLADDIVACADAIDFGIQARGTAGRLLSGVRVEFLADISAKCVEPIGNDQGGCYWPNTDTAAVEMRPRIWDTALCHELAHRARNVAGYGLDYRHEDKAFWQALPGASK